MSLFTSNFRRESTVIIAVLAVAVFSEATIRLFRPMLSVDIVHIRQIPEVAKTMGSKQDIRVLFLGNSLTWRGVNLKSVRAEFGANQGLFWFDKVNPDDTAILDWYYLFKKYFDGSRAPDYVVLGWAGTQLSDRGNVHADRIAAYYGGWSMTGELFRNDLRDSSARVDYILSSFLAVFSEKERIRVRLLSLAVPDYRDTAERFNAAVVSKSKAAAPPLAYTRLKRFLDLCRQRHVKVIASAMPIAQTYNIDPNLTEMLKENGAVLIDLRQVDGVTDSDYLDGYHLAPAGADLYSRALARELATILPGRAIRTADLSAQPSH